MPVPARLPRPRRHEQVWRVDGISRGAEGGGRQGVGGASSSMSEQCRRAFARGADLMAEQGLSIGDVTRVVYLVRDPEAFSSCLPVLRDVFGDARPAATVHMVPALGTPDAGIELELVASSREAG